MVHLQYKNYKYTVKFTVIKIKQLKPSSPKGCEISIR